MSANGNTGAVCRECALAAGFSPKNKAVGVWIDECVMCGERKPCTDLVHDWTRKRLPASAGGSAAARKHGGNDTPALNGAPPPRVCAAQGGEA